MKHEIINRPLLGFYGRGFYAMKDKVTIRLYLILKVFLLASETAG